MGSGELTQEQIHDVLSNRRRRILLEMLHSNGGSATARSLSEHIARVESGETIPPRNVRQSAYVSLHQTHLPKLNQLDIINYDDQPKTVTLTGNERQLAGYMKTGPKHGISWGELYIGLGLIGGVIVSGTAVGAPFLDHVDPLSIVLGCLTIVVIAGLVQTYQQGSVILARLTD